MEDSLYFKIYRYGKYYNPANLHYCFPGEEGDEVGCDRCLKEDIPTCIGWKEYDLCLYCASVIEEKYENGMTSE